MLKKVGILAVLISVALLAWTNLDRLRQLWNRDEVPQEVLAEAKRKVPEPSLPPRPGPSVATEYEDRYATIMVPEVSGLTIRPVEHRVLIARVPRISVTEPPSEAVRTWEGEVARINDGYQARLREEIQAIQRRLAREFRETVEAWVKIIGAGISGFAGVVSIVVSIRKERRDSDGSALGRRRRR